MEGMTMGDRAYKPIITQHRDRDCVNLYSEGVIIARLYDNRHGIIFDRCADIRTAIGLLPEIDYKAYFAEIGLTADMIRAIDSMPTPDINAK